MFECPEIPRELYGDSFERLTRPRTSKTATDTTSTSAPKRGERQRKDLNISESQAEWDLMVNKMKDCGIDQHKATEIIRARKLEFDQALHDWNISK